MGRRVGHGYVPLSVVVTHVHDQFAQHSDMCTRLRGAILHDADLSAVLRTREDHDVGRGDERRYASIYA